MRRLNALSPTRFLVSALGAEGAAVALSIPGTVNIYTAALKTLQYFSVTSVFKLEGGVTTEDVLLTQLLCVPGCCSSLTGAHNRTLPSLA